MTTITAAAAAGALVAFGVWVIAAGWAGQLPTTLTARNLKERVARRDHTTIRTTLAALGFVTCGLLTGWVAAAVGLGVVGWMAPVLVGVKARRIRAMARTEAVAVWAEMLRDTLAGSAGLREAIAATARVAPDAIAPELQALDARAERGSLVTALRTFAAEVNDPVADTIIAALVIAVERQASNLSGTLSAIAASSRQSTAMQLRVAASRARTFRSSQLICGITGTFMVVMVVFNRSYLTPFASLSGQIVLIIAAGLLGLAMFGLEKLSRPVTPRRLLTSTAQGQRL